MFIIDLLFIRHFGRHFLLYLVLARDHVELLRIIFAIHAFNLTLKTLRIYSKLVLIQAMFLLDFFVKPHLRC